jgi:hypothetical protein
VTVVRYTKNLLIGENDPTPLNYRPINILESPLEPFLPLIFSKKGGSCRYSPPEIEFCKYAARDVFGDAESEAVTRLVRYLP